MLLITNLIVFTQNRNNGVLIESINSGGYGIYVDKGVLYIEEKNSIIPLMPIEDIGIALKIE